MTKSNLICSLELLLLSASVYGVILPDHNCSEYFTYGIEDGNYIGLFTAPKAGLSRVSWSVSFVWQGPADSPIASLQHYPNTMQAVHNINSGRPSQIIVRFKNNIGEQLPKLVDLQVNNESLCSNTASEYN
ncbi:hypothetical protein KR054_001098 [Drosophila jambulina]|nr:hypothetical protein KR054_001098 [Drosophila jambulina]